MPMKLRFLFLFLAAEIGLCFFVFSDALWGKSLLAPLDIAPAFFEKYRYVDPSSSGVPKNHFIIDQLTYDLPIQHTIFEAYRRGEIPWWDPYTYCGRPLLADAHINGTDPIRFILYQIMAFVPAYNWTLILHSLLSGLGCLLLLRSWRFNPWSCLLLSLVYQFAGCSAIFFGHPWIQASFLYYSFLWMVWDKHMRQPSRWSLAWATLLVAGIFYSGNLQSHSYLALFSAAFVFGYAGLCQTEWKKTFPLVALSLFLGTCLAAPVLLGQLEFYCNGVRTIVPAGKLSWLSGIVSLSAVFPWALGTFRTLDLGKFVSQSGLGFQIFIGSAGFVLAMMSLFLKSSNPATTRPKRAAVILISFYFLILSSPLLGVFYTRSAGLAVLGLVVLAALAIEELISRQIAFRRAALFLATLATALVVSINTIALLIYPSVIPKVQQMVQSRAMGHSVLKASSALRNFQIENQPNEISFKNLETVFAFLSLMAFSAFLYSARWRMRPVSLILLLSLNLIPSILFFQRFIPRAPIDQWQRLLEGGPEQQPAIKSLCGTSLRLYEKSASINDKLFPNAMSHFYRVRTVHGYSALQPKSLLSLPATELENYQAQLADFIYEPHSGRLAKNNSPNLARFQWSGAASVKIEVEEKSLNEIALRFPSQDRSATLLWADTFYPGWRAEMDGQPVPLKFAPPCFTEIEVPARAKILVLKYRPRFLSAGIFAAIGSALILVVLIMKRLRTL